MTSAAVGTTSDVVFAARGLTKRYQGDVAAVENLTFEIRSGVVAGLLGPNGAGKTTTLRALLGLVHPSQGAATVFGRPFRELAAPWSRVGAVLDPPGFHPARTGRKHLEAKATAAGLSRLRVGDVLELVGLAARAGDRIGTYSLGMTQRLALATALLADPAALVLDEPANGLDPEGMRWIRALLRHLASRGKTVLISSHLLAEVAEMADEVVVIHHGRLVAHESVEALTARRLVRVRTPDSAMLQDALKERGAEVRFDGENLLVEGLETGEVGRVAAASGCVLLRLEEVRTALEEAFFELVSRDAAR